MLTIAQASRGPVDIFDARKAAADLEKLVAEFDGRERELRTAVAQYLKGALIEGRAKAEELLLKDRHGFEAGAKWLEHLQKSSVRFPGGSGSFVSPDGLVMTNHHVGADALQKLSSADRDLIKAGFMASKPEEELKCLDLELNVLVKIQDVTDQVQAELQKSFSSAAETAERYPAYASQIIAGAQEAFIDGQKWAYTAGIVAIAGGAVLIARMYPKHTRELELLDEYHRIDGLEPAVS